MALTEFCGDEGMVVAAVLLLSPQKKWNGCTTPIGNHAVISYWELVQTLQHGFIIGMDECLAIWFL